MSAGGGSDPSAAARPAYDPSSHLRSPLLLINALLLIGLVGASLYVFPDLPDRIPLHYGIDGEPDRWGRPTLLNWMGLPTVGGACALLTIAIGLIAPSRPGIVNMPGKERLLQLPPNAQRWVLAGLSNAMYLTAACLLIMFAMLQYGGYRGAVHGDGTELRVAALIIGIAVMPAIALSSIVMVQRRMDTAWKEHRQRAS
jgi:uncharacterized membrane protein